MKVICALHNCTNEVGTDRQKRRYVTCSAKCGKKHSLDKMTMVRAKRAGKVAVICENCQKMFTDYKGDATQTTCNRCRGIFKGPKTLGRRKNYNYDTELIGGAGIVYHDFRTTVCRKDGQQCINFSACSESVIEHRDGAFEYQTNGGVNCFEPDKDVVRVNYGTSGAMCSENY